MGSNIGKREAFIKTAVERIGNLEYIKIIKMSDVIETKPVGKTDQPDFLNAVVEVSADLTPQELLTQLLTIEADMGRERTQKWGPRIIDLDILFWGNKVIQEDGLKIPHPEFINRPFNIKLMYNIAPDFIHPEVNKTMESLYGTD